MSRYIDADELIKTISSTKFTSLGANDILVTCCQIVIDNAPTADVRDNRYAIRDVHGEGQTHYYTCGLCGTAVDQDDKYCRECGAILFNANECIDTGVR